MCISTECGILKLTDVKHITISVVKCLWLLHDEMTTQHIIWDFSFLLLKDPTSGHATLK